MLAHERRSGAVKPGLGMDDQLDRYAAHHLRVAALETEAFSEARLWEELAQAQADAPASTTALDPWASA